MENKEIVFLTVVTVVFSIAVVIGIYFFSSTRKNIRDDFRPQKAEIVKNKKKHRKKEILKNKKNQNCEDEEDNIIKVEVLDLDNDGIDFFYLLSFIPYLILIISTVQTIAQCVKFIAAVIGTIKDLIELFTNEKENKQENKPENKNQ